jgi:hypothetical protein
LSNYYPSVLDGDYSLAISFPLNALLLPVNKSSLHIMLSTKTTLSSIARVAVSKRMVQPAAIVHACRQCKPLTSKTDGATYAFSILDTNAPDRILVDNPIVDIDGDEMTRIIWQIIKDKACSTRRSILIITSFIYLVDLSLCQIGLEILRSWNGESQPCRLPCQQQYAYSDI